MCFLVQFFRPCRTCLLNLFSPLTQQNTYFWKQKVSETTTAKTAEEVLAELQSRARYVFDVKTFADMTGRHDNAHGIRITLKRLEKRGLVTPLHKRPMVYLIVPAEYRAYGAPPLSWWLHDAMQFLDDPQYYACLHSAARYCGSSHYALQADQVMVSGYRAPLTAGKRQVVFTTRTDISDAPTVRTRGEKGAYLVSTREATLLDLMRHRSKVGGLESIARVARDFGPHLTQSELVRALDAMGQVAVAQRIGFLFDELKLEEMATVVEQWLSPRTRTARLLAEPVPDTLASMTTSKWGIIYSSRDINEILESQ
jgi:predicted transcriptional regulator of viral defense system